MSVSGTRGIEPLGCGRPAKALAALLLNANRPVSVDSLIGVLWTDRPPATARQQAQNVVGMLRSTLRRATPGAEIERLDSHYVMHVDPADVDSLTFEALRQRGDRLSADGDVGPAVRVYESALGLWRGTALHGVDSPVLAAETQRLDDWRLHVTRRLTELHQAAGRDAAAIELLTEGVLIYPYDEHLHCRLAESLHRTSRTVDGVRLLHTLRSRLRTDLGVDLGRDAAVLLSELSGTTTPADTLPQTCTEADVLGFVRATITQLSSVLATLTEYERRHSGVRQASAAEPAGSRRAGPAGGPEPARLTGAHPQAGPNWLRSERLAR